MKFKIGDRWISAEPGRPIMVQLEPQDMDNIKNARKIGGDRYAVFCDDEPVFNTVALKDDWIDFGYEAEKENEH